jgi:hypothetical protein
MAAAKSCKVIADAGVVGILQLSRFFRYALYPTDAAF